MTFFRLEPDASGDRFIPLDEAVSLWAGAHLRGPAVTSLLARAVERGLAEQSTHGRGVEDAAGLRPVRATFELHSPVPMAHCRTQARVLRRGRTLTIVESEIFSGDDDRVLSRCRATFIRAASEAAEEEVWSSPLPAECVPPAPEYADRAKGGRLYRSSHTEWSGSRAGHQNAARNLVWVFDVPIVEGEEPTRFECAARAADLGNYVVNAGAHGLSHINTDVTLSLARLPETGGVGACSELRTAHGPVSVGTAHLFDRLGACGTASITAVQHTKTRLDYGSANA